MKSRTKKILIAILALLTILFIGAYLRLPDKELKSTLESTSKTKERIKEEYTASLTNKNTLSSAVKIEVAKTPEVKIKATVVVSGKRYEASISENQNIYDLMTTIRNNSKGDDFTFKVKDYQGMGYFVDVINGVSGSSGAYWIYYINEEKASMGISQYIVKDGDVIRWAQEGI